MKKYEKPFLQVIMFEAEDIITSSGENERDVIFDADEYFGGIFD